MASQDAGGPELSESTPEFFQWRWSYHAPSVTIWAIGACVLVWAGIRRDTDGWRFVVPAILAFLLLQMDGVGVLTVSLAAAWAAVWFTCRYKTY